MNSAGILWWTMMSSYRSACTGWRFSKEFVKSATGINRRYYVGFEILTGLMRRVDQNLATYPSGLPWCNTSTFYTHTQVCVELQLCKNPENRASESEPGC